MHAQESKFGNTPLHYASYHCFPARGEWERSVVERIIKRPITISPAAGGNIYQQRTYADKKTPLDMADENCSPEQAEITKEFMKAIAEGREPTSLAKEEEPAEGIGEEEGTTEPDIDVDAPAEFNIVPPAEYDLVSRALAHVDQSHCKPSWYRLAHGKPRWYQRDFSGGAHVAYA